MRGDNLAARILTGLLVAVMVIAGIALLFGGSELIAAGGSPYYLLSGAALVATAVGLAWRRNWAVRPAGSTWSSPRAGTRASEGPRRAR